MLSVTGSFQDLRRARGVCPMHSTEELLRQLNNSHFKPTMSRSRLGQNRQVKVNYRATSVKWSRSDLEQTSDTRSTDQGRNYMLIIFEYVKERTICPTLQLTWSHKKLAYIMYAAQGESRPWGHIDMPNAIELSPVTPIDKQDYDSESRSVLSARYRTQRTREKIQFVTLCWFVYLEGWNDGSNGPLLPRIQKVYGVGYAIVSLIFICACVGFITGAVSNVILAEKLGFGKVMVLGSLCQVLAYCIESTGPPFPVFVFAYFINGIGIALQNANSVGYVACLKENAEAKMGVFMAVYGAGALSSPLVATQFSHLTHWNLHFLTCLGIAITNTIALIIVFRLKPQAECLSEIGIVHSDNNASEHSHLRQIFANKDVHLLAAFTLLYVGVEVTLGGWIVTYILDVRGGGPSSGYVSSGFFGGLMIGRVALLWLNEKIGERLALFIYSVLAIIFEFIVWFLPSLIGDAIIVCVIGVLLGPLYPIMVNHAGRILPRRILTGSIGWIAGVGQAGSAMVPFMVGAIAQTAGMKVLQPVVIGILGIMTGLWALVCYGSSSRRPN